MVSSLQRVFAAHEELGRQAILRGLRVVRKKLHARTAVVFGEIIESVARDGGKSLNSRITRKSADAGIVISVSTADTHVNRYGQEKPAAFWLEHGTKERFTKGKPVPNHSGQLPNRKRAYQPRVYKHSTGRIAPPGGALEKISNRVDESIIDDAVINEIQKACDKIIKKHGL